MDLTHINALLRELQEERARVLRAIAALEVLEATQAAERAAADSEREVWVNAS